MDPRRIELQIRIILATYRGERRRLSSETMVEFRRHAIELLDQLDDGVRASPELAALYAAAREELDRDSATPEQSGPRGDQSPR